MLCTVVSTQGSAPREAGAWMAVFADGATLGSIGGGHLEFEAIASASGHWPARPSKPQRRFALGPSLGQCCGGVVQLRFEAIGRRCDAAHARLRPTPTRRRMPVALFGGGHVGHAIVRALVPLPVRVHWVDSRDEVFPAELPRWIAASIRRRYRPQWPTGRACARADHELFPRRRPRHRRRLPAAPARAADLPFIGLIGSQSKWATFSPPARGARLCDAELAQVTCPIGVPGVVGKEPEVIAAAVAAQLMQLR